MLDGAQGVAARIVFAVEHLMRHFRDEIGARADDRGGSVDAVLREWLGWTPEQVREAMHNGRDDRHVNLKQKVPVYIVYFTTFIRDGRLYFGNDLYNRDRPLVEAVKNGAEPTVSAVQAVRLLRELAED